MDPGTVVSCSLRPVAAPQSTVLHRLPPRGWAGPPGVTPCDHAVTMSTDQNQLGAAQGREGIGSWAWSAEEVARGPRPPGAALRGRGSGGPRLHAGTGSPVLAPLGPRLQVSVAPSEALTAPTHPQGLLFPLSAPSACPLEGPGLGATGGPAVSHQHPLEGQRLRPPAEAPQGLLRLGGLPLRLEHRLPLPGGIRRLHREVR